MSGVASLHVTGLTKTSAFPVAHCWVLCCDLQNHAVPKYMLHPIGPQRVAFPGHNGACPNAVTHGLNHSVIWEQTGPSTTTSKAVLGFMLPQVTYKTTPFQNTCSIPLVPKEWHFLVTTVPVQVQSHMG